MPEKLPDIEMKIHLKTVEALFAEPDADPFDPDSRYVSGMDELVNQLRMMRIGNRKVRVAITLPAQAMQAGLREKLRAAWTRYCQAQMEASQLELTQLRQRGRFSALSSAVIIFLGGVLVLIVANLKFIGDTLQAFLVSGFSVFSWVTVWEPFGIYVYQWRAPARNILIFKRLKEAELLIEPGD
jgi:hypothetical protein